MILQSGCRVCVLVSPDLKTEGNIAQGVSSTVLNRALSSNVSITSMRFFVLGWNNFKKCFQWARQLVQLVSALAVKTDNLSSIARPHMVGGENELSQGILRSPHVGLGMHTCTDKCKNQ